MKENNSATQTAVAQFDSVSKSVTQLLAKSASSVDVDSVLVASTAQERAEKYVFVTFGTLLTAILRTCSI